MDNNSQTNDSLNSFSNYEFDEENKYKESIRPMQEKSQRFFYTIWPSVNRTLNFFFYQTLRTTKGIFKYAFSQLGGKG